MSEDYERQMIECDGVERQICYSCGKQIDGNIYEADHGEQYCRECYQRLRNKVEWRI